MLNESNRYMILERVDRWRRKASNENDAFDKYASLFIAYNTFYNLFEETRNPTADLSKGDSRKATLTLDLVPDRV